MKILSGKQIREADAHTIENEPISSIDLMERAALACSQWISSRFDSETPIHIFCGIGNNGGDGLAIARLLSTEGYQVSSYLLSISDSLSEDCKINLERLKPSPISLGDSSDFEQIKLSNDALVVDAIFGSGLNRSLDGLSAELVKLLNHSNVFRLAIDIPSGLFSEDNSLNEGEIFAAHYTLSFELPKLSFLLPERGNFVGEFELLDIGLDKTFLLEANSNYHYLNAGMLSPLLKQRAKFSHKGDYGHALLIAGSYGKMGAAALAAEACLRSGAGLLTAECVRKGLPIMQGLVPEAMCRENTADTHIEGLIEDQEFNAIAIGPGIGTEDQTQTSLKVLIQNAKVPLLFDADALNILGENKTWLAFLPKHSILTPHPGEFQRLAGHWKYDLQAIELQLEMSKKHGVFIVLKGAHTRISTPDGKFYFNSSGNPGMATAGSGDSLSGIILALLAQHYSPEQACVLGVYLHGLAGDIAADLLGFESLIASDIINSIPEAFAQLRT